MSNTIFDVTYRVGFTDMNAFFSAWQRRTWFDRANRRRFMLYAFVIFVLMLFGMRSVLSGRHFWPSNLALAAVFGVFTAVGFAFGSGLIAFILTFVISPLLTYAAQLTTFAFGPLRKRANRLRATSAGIDKTADDIESQTKWRELTAVVETRKAVLLFTGRNSATIVPKSAFASPAEAEAFATFAKAQWDDARSVF